MQFIYDFTMAVLSNLFTDMVTKSKTEYIYVDASNNSNDDVFVTSLLVVVALISLSLNVILGIALYLFLAILSSLILLSAWKASRKLGSNSLMTLMAFVSELYISITMFILSVYYEYAQLPKVPYFSLSSMLLVIGLVSVLSTIKICLTDYIKTGILLKHPEYILFIKVFVFFTSVIIFFIFSILE